MTPVSPARRRHATRVAVATGLAASLCAGLAAPAYAAPADAIAPHPDAWGRYYVDAYASNATAKTTPETNVAIGALATMLDYWTPEAVLTPEWDASGKFLPESVGTVVNRTVLDANIAEAARITQTRTDEQAAAAYVIDRRHQSYSAIDGLGPWAGAFRTATNAGTTIPDKVPADATTVKYDDGGNANGAWADQNTEYGDMVALVNQLRNTSASTNPSKTYYSYARPFRWSDDVLVLPTLEPAKRGDAEALSDGGYPSGHTNAGTLASLALAYAAPERFQEILTHASEIGNSRIVGGMHSPADVIGGRILATAIAAAALNQPGNAELKQNARADAEALLATPASGADAYADRDSNEELYLERLTYGLPSVGDTTLPVTVPKGAEVLLESRLPYLDADQRRWVLQSTGLPSGHALLDDDEGWGRLNLFAAADGYSAFDTDVVVEMDAADGGFSASDTWRNDIDGEGSLTKSGSGVLTLAGANTFTGGTVVEDGTLAAASASAFGTGSVTIVDGIVSESVSAPVVIGGDFAIEDDGVLALTLDGATPALDIDGVASFDGTLEVSLAEGFVPSDDLVLATFDSLGTGSEFDSVQVDGLPAGYTPTIEIRDGAVHLVNATPAPGTLTAGEPSITGSLVVGDPLTVAAGTWGPAPVALAYQWYRGADAIAGATSARYTPVAADVARVLSVTVTGTKTGFVSQTRTATASGPVVPRAVVTEPGVSDPGASGGSGASDPSEPGASDALASPAGSLAATGGSVSLAVTLGALGLLGIGAAFVVARLRQVRSRRA
jgi:autotransporter-associated beta strand protein